ncbi:MAG: RHS repeat-associated core domain-containing protein, partial [bacterium]|nr:RHS repeat-associated core domain-containing protein [bacterium]
ENTGLVYFGARYYDPETARFLTRDSLLGQTGTPPSLHRYLYAHSNPTAYVDQNGNSATALGFQAGFFWGFGQMAGAMINDIAHGNVRSGWEYAGVWGQNIIGGAELGASIDVAILSAGWALPLSGSLGAAGFDALTIEGRGQSAGDFAKNQATNAAFGLVLGHVGAKAAPFLGKIVGPLGRMAGAIFSKIPGNTYLSRGAGYVSRKVVEKAGSLSREASNALSKQSFQQLRARWANNITEFRSGRIFGKIWSQKRNQAAIRSNVLKNICKSL